MAKLEFAWKMPAQPVPVASNISHRAGWTGSIQCKRIKHDIPTLARRARRTPPTAGAKSIAARRPPTFKQPPFTFKQSPLTVEQRTFLRRPHRHTARAADTTARDTGQIKIKSRKRKAASRNGSRSFLCDEDRINSHCLTPLPETGANIIRQPPSHAEGIGQFFV